MRNPRLWILGIVLAILVAINLPRFAEREAPAAKNTARLEVRSGEAMADLAAEQLKDGKNIVLVAYDPSAQHAIGQIEEAFKKQADNRNLTLLKTLHLDSPERREDGMQVQRLDKASLEAGLTGLDKVDAIVSLCGEPVGKPADLKSLPPFFCLCDEGDRIPALMKAEIVQAAYVPRRSTPTSVSKNDWFAMLYTLALPDNVEALYAN